MASLLKNIPIWIFHGEKDKIIPVSKSLEMADLLEKSGNKPKLTVYADAGHDSWTKTYNNPDLYDWFLKHEL